MKRKMASKETCPSNKTTNGGNGSYMRRKVVKDQVRGDKRLSKGMVANVTTTGRPSVKA